MIAAGRASLMRAIARQERKISKDTEQEEANEIQTNAGIDRVGDWACAVRPILLRVLRVFVWSLAGESDGMTCSDLIFFYTFATMLVLRRWP